MKLDFYINFDFGLRGDYKGLYKWLDKNRAEERGNCYALIKGYQLSSEFFFGLTDVKEKNLKFIKHIQQEIKESVELSSTDRIYLTFALIDSNKLGGAFLFGKKQSTPWEGHYSESGDCELDFGL